MSPDFPQWEGEISKDEVDTQELPPDLAEIVAVWPNLSMELRHAIVKMIRWKSTAGLDFEAGKAKDLIFAKNYEKTWLLRELIVQFIRIY